MRTIFRYGIYAILFLFSSNRGQAQAPNVATPTKNNKGYTVEGLVGRFTFEKSAQDEVGNFGKTELKGVTIDNGALQVDRGTWAYATYHGSPLLEKTLVSFIHLKSLELNGGSPVTFTTNDASYFNGLVLGEVNGAISLSALNIYWSITSEELKRTKFIRPAYKEVSTHHLLKMAVTFKNVNGQAQISIYRNGEQIAQYTQGQLEKLAPNNSKVIFGMRNLHDKTRAYTPPYQVWLNADIEEVQIYNRALSQAEIKSLDFVKE